MVQGPNVFWSGFRFRVWELLPPRGASPTPPAEPALPRLYPGLTLLYPGIAPA